MLRHCEDPDFEHFHFHHLVLVKQLLTMHWYKLRRGQEPYAMNKWCEAFELLELDVKARRGLLLRVQQGLLAEPLPA